MTRANTPTMAKQPAGGSEGALHVVLVEPEIPGNTGNLGRTCVAIGATLHLVEPLGFDLSESRVKRAGLDYWQHVDLKVWPSWQTIEPELSEFGQPWFFSAEAERSFWDVEFERDCVLVFGKESVGLSREIRDRHRDRLIKVPMNSPHIRSLNLSNAAAVAVFEVLRQRSL